MKLLNEVKKLRELFPDMKIRQLTDEYNRKMAFFVLSDCTESIRLFFEYKYIILEFYGCKTVYGYPEREFTYMVSELKNLIECRTLVLSVESAGIPCGSMIVSKDSVTDEFIAALAKRLCLNKFGSNIPKSAFVNMFYCNSEYDTTEYCELN